MLDHEIGLTSSPGRGSHFSVALPVADAAVMPAIVPAEAAAAATGIAGTLVLCIDNEPQVLDGLATLLTGWGCTPLVARSAADAEAAIAAARHMPDVAIVDYHLDAADGLAAIEALRNRFDPGLAAVLMTADRSPAVRLAAGRAAIPVLYKPVRPAALRAVIGQSRASRSVAAE